MNPHTHRHSHSRLCYQAMCLILPSSWNPREDYICNHIYQGWRCSINYIFIPGKHRSMSATDSSINLAINGTVMKQATSGANIVSEYELLRVYSYHYNRFYQALQALYGTTFHLVYFACSGKTNTSWCTRHLYIIKLMPTVWVPGVPSLFICPDRCDSSHDKSYLPSKESIWYYFPIVWHSWWTTYSLMIGSWSKTTTYIWGLVSEKSSPNS